MNTKGHMMSDTYTPTTGSVEIALEPPHTQLQEAENARPNQ